MIDGLIEGCTVDGDCIACVFDDPAYVQNDCDYAKEISCKEECQYWKPGSDEDVARAYIKTESFDEGFTAGLREAAGILIEQGLISADGEAYKAILAAIPTTQDNKEG